MIKKSKSRSKVTTSANTIDSPEEEPTSEVLQDKPRAEALSTSPARTSTSPPTVVKNGKIAQTSPSGFNSVSPSKPQYPNTSSTGPSLAGIPGIVDDFLAPKFVKVLNLRDHNYEKVPPPSLSEYKAKAKEKAAATDSNANKVNKDKDSSAKDSPSTSQKKNKRKKSTPVKNSNANTSYDSDDGGRELDVLNRSFNSNGNESQYESSLPTHHPSSGLTSKDVSNLAQLQRIRKSAFRYEGNNIVLVSNSDNEGEQYAGTSSYDDYNYNYDGDDDLVTGVGGGAGNISVPTDEISTLGLDHEDDDDEEARVGSWSLSQNHVDYGYSSKQQVSSSVASSESENTGSSISTTASGSHPPPVVESVRNLPPLAACTTIWDGVNNPCEIKDCSKPATHKCSQCKDAFYCSEEHQQNDWERHKSECLPYQMEPRFGDDVSVAVAAKNIPQGMIIFKEKPLLVLALAEPDNDFLNVMDLPCIQKQTNKIPSKKARRRGLYQSQEFFCEAVKPACFGCLKTVEFIGSPRTYCGTCKLPLCSYKCYMDPWHQASECQVVRNQGGWEQGHHRCYHSLYMDIEIVRALQLEGMDTAAWEKFLQLKQNLRVEAYKNSERYRRFIEYYRELVPISAKMSGYHDDLIGNVHSIITALSFRPSLQSAYKLIFGTQILFGHDCVPNTFHYLEEGATGKVNGMSLVTRAAVPILRQEIITIDFSPSPFLYYPLRRMVLSNVLSIDNCQCKRCRNPAQLGDFTCHIKCPRCRGIISPENASSWKNSVWGCNSCLEEFSYRMIAKITEECREEMASILTRPKQFVVSALRQFISKREDQDLAPGHSIIIQAWSFIETHLKSSLAATRLAGPAPRYPESTIEEYRLLGRCCEVIEQHLEGVRPGICYDRAIMYLNRYYVNLAVSAKRFGLRLTNRNEYIQELMKCTKLLQDALKIFTLYEGYRDVHLRVNEVMGALCTTKSFLTEQMRTNLKECSSRSAAATAAAASSTAAVFRDN